MLRALRVGRMRGWRRYEMGFLVLVFLAFALRVYRLDNQSLWSDEYITLLRSSLPLGELLAKMPTEHAPLYFVAQHFWLSLAGESDFALRFPSVIGGVLAVPLLYFLGKALFGRTVGWMAAFVLAVNPFHVWYAQDARMYTLLTAFVLGSLGCLARALWEDQPRWWVGYVVFTLLSLYTHYYGGLALVAGVVFSLVWLALAPSRSTLREADRPVLVTSLHAAFRREALKRRWSAHARQWRNWLAALLAIVLLYLPWLPRALRVLSFPGWRPPADLRSLPARYLTYYSVGTSMPPDVGWRWTLGFLFLAGLGVIFLVRHRTHGGAFLAGYLLVPLLFIAFQAARDADFHERYFITITPAYYLLIALGIAWLSLSPSAESLSLIAALPLLFVAGTEVVSLRNHYFDPAFGKPDYKAYTQHIREVSRPEDALVLYGPGHGLTRRYSGGEGFPKIYNLRSTRNRDKTQAEIEALLAEIARKHGRVWLAVQFREPGAVQEWFERHGYPLEGGWLRGILLYYYAFPPETLSPLLPPRTVEGDAPVRVAGYRVTPQAVPPGEVLYLDVMWEAEQPVTFDGKVSARLMGPDDHTWASLDRRPLGGFAPTREWAPGQAVEDHYGLRVPPDAPAGEYRLLVILYDAATLAEHLRVNLGAVVVIAEHQVPSRMGASD